MDARDFLIELNSSLNFHFAGQSVITGTYGGYIYEISFEPDGRLKAHTNVRLFGDLPVEEHIAEAYRKLSCFSSYTLVEDSIDLFADAESLDEDKVFSITVDISSFSGTLNSFGYKTVAAPEPETESVQQPAAYQNPVISQIETDEEEPHLPRKIGLGILGALIGTVASVGLWILLSLTNYMWPFVLGAIVVLIAPILLYETFTKEKTSAVQITISLFFSAVGLILGDRLIWTFDIMRNFDDVTFEQAYWEIPYLVEDGIVNSTDYYQDYIVIVIALVLFTIIFFGNYIKGGMSVSKLLSKRAR